MELAGKLAQEALEAGLRIARPKGGEACKKWIAQWLLELKPLIIGTTKNEKFITLTFIDGSQFRIDKAIPQQQQMFDYTTDPFLDEFTAPAFLKKLRDEMVSVEYKHQIDKHGDEDAAWKKANEIVDHKLRRKAG